MRTRFRSLEAVAVGETRVPKYPGSTFQARLDFEYIGGGTFDIGVGFAPAALVGYQNVTHWFWVTETLQIVSTWIRRTVTLTSTIPNDMALGLKDVLKWIQTVGGPRDVGGNGFEKSDWDSDTYEILPAAFRGLLGSYS